MNCSEKKQVHINKRDILFIFTINILPILQTTGFLPSIIAQLGINITSILLILPIFISSLHPSFNKIKKNYIYIFTLFTITYIVITFLRSTNEYGFWESFTNFRYSFSNIFIFFLAIPYIFSLPREKLVRIINILILLTVVESILYIGHTIGILHFYTGNAGIMENTKLIRSYMGFPPLIIPAYGVSLISFFITRQKKHLIYSILFIMTIFLSYTRSVLASVILISLILIFFLSIKKLINIGSIIKSFIILSIFTVCIYFIFPSSMNFWIEKIDSTINSELKNEEGTYAVREKLIDEALYQNRNNTELIGLGYKRDSDKGEYSLVQGTDTYIAPVIFCEGFIGLFLRISIILSVLFTNLKKGFRLKTRENICINMLIISLILIEIPNYIQTTLFSIYSQIPLFIIILTQLYQKKNENYRSNPY